MPELGEVLTALVELDAVGVGGRVGPVASKPGLLELCS